MKVLLICAAAFVCGVLLGTQLHRYDYARVSPNWPARFDRWTGKLELVQVSMTDEWMTAHYPPPAPTASIWPGTPAEPILYVPVPYGPTATPRSSDVFVPLGKAARTPHR